MNYDLLLLLSFFNSVIIKLEINQFKWVLNQYVVKFTFFFKIAVKLSNPL